MKDDFHRRSDFTLEERADWVSRYRAGGLGLRDFAFRHGLPAGQLHYWVYGRSRLKPVRSAGSPIPATRFQEMPWSSLAGPAWAAEVALDSGVTLRLASSAPAEWTAFLIETLRRPIC
ncbi:MAG: hypothetical protein ACRETL_12185 [Gammaproteobacteria bacterium]